MTRPCWLRRAVRNRHRHAIEQGRVDGVEEADDEARTRRNILIYTGSPPKKQGFMSRMQENFAVLKENDTVVVVQQWDGVEINVDVLKPCKVAVLRQKVRQFIAKRDDIMPEVEKHEHLRHRYVLLFQGQMLQDEDTVPKGVYGDVNEDQWPNKVYVARSKYRPPFEETEIDVDSLPSEWSIGTGSVSIKPLEYEEEEPEKDEDEEEALRRSMESQRRSQEMSARRRGKATKNKSVASKLHPHSASFDLRRELKLLRCPPHIIERLCSYGYDDRVPLRPYPRMSYYQHLCMWTERPEGR